MKKKDKKRRRNTLRQVIDNAIRPLYSDAIIDFILTNTNKAQSIGTLDWNLSDHLPTFIDIKKEKNKCSKAQFIGCCYTNFNNKEFIRLLHDSDITFLSNISDVT